MADENGWRPLTDAQLWALKAIADGHGSSPARLGAKMMERPGVEERRRGGNRDSPQGLGRVGGTMMARLQKMGFVSTSYRDEYGNWGATKARMTDKGRAALAKARGAGQPLKEGE